MDRVRHYCPQITLPQVSVQLSSSFSARDPTDKRTFGHGNALERQCESLPLAQPSSSSCRRSSALHEDGDTFHELLVLLVGPSPRLDVRILFALFAHNKDYRTQQYSVYKSLMSRMITVALFKQQILISKAALVRLHESNPFLLWVCRGLKVAHAYFGVRDLNNIFFAGKLFSLIILERRFLYSSFSETSSQSAVLIVLPHCCNVYD